MLTNFKTMRTRVDRLAQLKKMQEDGTFDMLPKKEVMKHLGEMEKLEKYLGGVKEMKMSSPPTMTPSAPSASSPPPWPTPFRKAVRAPMQPPRKKPPQRTQSNKNLKGA